MQNMWKNSLNLKVNKVIKKNKTKQKQTSKQIKTRN